MLKRHLTVFTLYVALTLVTTYPLVMRFFSHIPGSETWAFDEYIFLWNFWWFKHAVFDLGVNPFYSDQIFYPIGFSLVLYTFTLLNAMLAVPLEFLFGYAAASNTLVTFSFVAGAFGGYLLADYWLRQSRRFPPEFLTPAAFFAGIVFAFTSSRFVYSSLGHTNFVCSQFFPFYVLFFIKTLSTQRTKPMILTGLFAALAIMTETTYAVFIVLFSTLYLLFAWCEQRVAHGWFTRVTLAAVIAGILASPIIVPALFEIIRAGYVLPGWGHAEKLLVDLAGLITPTSLHPLNRNWEAELNLVRQGTSRFTDVNTVFLGYATLILAALGAWIGRKQLVVWIVSAVTFTLFSLGPLLHINGKSVFDFEGLEVSFPMPFLILHYIPFLKENRVPNRFSILVTLSLAVLVAYAVAWLFSHIVHIRQRIARVAAVFSLGLLLLAVPFEHLAIPLSLTDARVPAVYSQIAQEPGAFAILSLPWGLRNSFTTQGAEDTRTQFYQSIHEKYLLSGNTSRNPPSLFEYFDRVPLFHSLAQVQLYQPVSAETLARDRAQAPFLAAFYDIRYVVVNAPAPNRLPFSDTRDATFDYIQKVLPLGEKIYDRDGVIAYRVNQAALPARQQIAFGTDAAHPYQANGWDRDETMADTPANWANQQEARILFPIRELGDYQVTVRALPFTYANASAQTMEFFVNGEMVQKFELTAGWENYSTTIPVRLLRRGINPLTLKFGYAVRPRDVLPANFAIGSTGTTSPVEIVVSAGDSSTSSRQAVGSIKVNGRERSPLGRGYNVVVIDSKSGVVVNARAFNTADDRAESRAMTALLNQIPQGFIVAVASQEHAGINLGDQTVAGLRSLGGQVDLRQQPNQAHALIGVKGAPAGSALEQATVGAPLISIGRSLDERARAAAVSVITLEKK